jgi:mannose-6-phosphate isomerase class I
VFILNPIFHKTIWGGNRLVSVYGGQAEGLGHLYSLRCKDKNSNKIINGKYAGEHLYDIIGEYPLSLAIVDAAQDLSIQVHPSGDSAKYESYFFIEAPKSGYIYCGIDNISSKNILSAIESDMILPHIEQVTVKKGDYIFIEPCTVHALTAGSLVYEIEHGEDNTYRLFDYNRSDTAGKKRSLQVQEAINILEVSLKSTTYKYQPNTSIGEKTYTTKYLTNITTYTNAESSCECITLLSGAATIEGIPLKTGMTVILEPNEKLEGLAIDQCIVARPLI